MVSDKKNKKIFSFKLILDLALALLALLFSSFIVFFSLAFYFSSNIEKYQPQIESYLGQKTGLQWQIKDLVIHWERLNPRITIETVNATIPPIKTNADTNKTTDSVSVLSASAIDVYIDASKSLLHRELRLFGMNLGIDTLVLSRTEKGVMLAGSKVVNTEKKGFDSLAFFNALNYSFINIKDIWLINELGNNPSSANTKLFLDASSPFVSRLDALSLKLSDIKRQRSLAISLQSDDAIEAAVVQAEYKGEIGDSDFEVNGFADIDFSKFEAFFKLYQVPSVVETFDISVGFNKKADESLYLSMNTFQNKYNNKINNQENKKLAGIVNLEWLIDNSIRWVWSDFELLLPNDNFIFPYGGGEYHQKDKNTFYCYLSQLNIYSVNQFLYEFDLPENIKRILSTLNIKGSVKDVYFEYSDSGSEKLSNKQEEWFLTSELKSVSGDSWKGSPAFSGLTGSLFVTNDYGVVEASVTSNFSILFPKAYNEAFQFASGNAVVKWQAQKNHLVVESKSINLKSSQGGLYTGKFKFIDDKNKLTGDRQLYLSVGVEDEAADNLLVFVPKKAPEKLHQWLAQTDIQGKLGQAMAVFNGSIKKGRVKESSTNLYFDVIDGALNFWPEWPRMENISGDIAIQNHLVDFNITNSKLSSILVDDLIGKIDLDRENQTLQLSSKLDSDLKYVHSFFMQSPLQETLRPIMGDWKAAGSFENGSLILGMPLNDGLENAKIKFTGTVSNGVLDLGINHLVLNDINGVFNYDTDQLGFYSDLITARYLGQKVNVSFGITDELKRDNYKNGDINIIVDGTLPLEVLKQNYQQPLLGFLSGQMPFTLNIERSNGKALISAKSDLQGLEINAPYPFRKSATNPASLDLQWLMNDDFPLTVNYNNSTAAAIDISNGKFEGVAVLNQSQKIENIIEDISTTTINNLSQKGILEKNKVKIQGALSVLNLTEWIDATKQYRSFDALNKVEDSTQDIQSEPLLIVVSDLQVDKLNAFDHQLENSYWNALQQNDHWQFEFKASPFSGSILLPNVLNENEDNFTTNINTDDPIHFLNLPELETVNNRIVINLDYLNLSSEFFKQLKGGRTQRALNKTENFFPPLSISINNLISEKQSIGFLSFNMTGSQNALLVHNLDANYHSLLVTSDKDDGLLWAKNPDGKVSSTLSIDLSSEDLQPFFNNLYKEDSSLPLESENFNASFFATWDGMPYDFDALKLKGSLSFNFSEGRFYETPETATGLLKLIGLINFDTFLRRIQLDFKDIYERGLSFNEVKGGLNLDSGMLEFFDTPITVDAPGSNFSMNGMADMTTSTVDAELVATLPVSNNLPWIAALTAGLPAAAGAFIMTKVFDTELESLSSAVYKVNGDISSPDVELLRVFDRSAKKDSKDDDENVEELIEE